MSFFKKHFLLILFFLGLVARLSIIYFDYSWDVNNHMVWAKDFLARGPHNFYETQSSNVFASLTPNYPPLAIFIFTGMKLLNPLIHSAYWWLNLHVSIIPSNIIFFLEKTVFLAGLMKIPAIFADLGIAYLVFLFAKKIIPKNSKDQIITTCLILFNPAFIFNSGLWGQIDSIPIFFILLSVFFLLYTKHDLVSTIIFTLALLVKPTALVFLPVYLVLFIKKFGIKKSVINLLMAHFVFWLFFLLFIKDKNIFFYPYQVYLDKILAAQSLAFVTNGAFNFWVLVTGIEGIKDTAAFIFGIPYRFFGYAIAGTVNVFVILCLIKSKKAKEDIFIALFITVFSGFLFLTKMHERYSLLPLVFLLIFSLKKIKLVNFFALLSLTSFINHYHSWAVPRIENLVSIINSKPFIYFISLINITVFFYFLKIFLLDSPKDNK